MDLLGDLNRVQGQTVVMVMHAPEIGQQANRIVRMRDGRIEDAGFGQGVHGMIGTGRRVYRAHE